MATFYDSISDTNLTNDFEIKQPDMFIQKHEVESTGIVVISTAGNDTLYDTTQTWTVNAYASTTGLNLMIKDDNSKFAVGKIISNTATTLTFQGSAMTLIEDGVTAPTLTASSTYSYRILTPSAYYAFGEFLGYANDITWSAEPEIAQFKYGIPRQLIREDLLENVHSLNANIFSTRFNLTKALYGMSTYGSQTAQTEAHFGSASFNTDYYQVTLLGQTVAAKALQYTFFKTKMKISGERNFSEEGYKVYPTMFSIFRDTLRDTTSVDFGFCRRTT